MLMQIKNGMGLVLEVAQSYDAIKYDMLLEEASICNQPKQAVGPEFFCFTSSRSILCLPSGIVRDRAES